MSAIHAILGPVLRAGLTWLGRRRLAQTDGTLTVKGLSAPVEVLRDRWGVPHIYAQSTRDLFFAQGFVHAQDRLWQMELNRRTAHGRLSELFGELALDTDRTVRTFGFSRLGKADWESASPAVREVFTAYADGVNAYLEHPGARMPVEFTLLGHHPEPWSPLDSAAFGRVMIWQLSHAWYGEIVRARLIEKLGAERAADLEIHYSAGNPVTLPHGIEFNRLEAGGKLMPAPGPFLNPGMGSNAWVVTGRRSETGRPVLCNDMHLPLSLPSLWYENHLHATDGYHVTGVSLPAVPLVMVGHNAHLAWGMTLAFTDAEDLFVEQFDPQNDGRYRFRDEWLEADLLAEPIQVKGRREPFIEEVLVTRHGPVISGVVGGSQQRLAVCSMALRPCPALSGWLALNQARNWDQFVEAMRSIEAPQLNVAYADVSGNIGYWVTGKVPVRARGDGSVPAPGWSGEYEWVGEVPFEEMPHALNPRDGYLVTCNHKIVAADYPHFLGNVWMNGYRARRFDEVITGKARLAWEDHRALHLDFTCLPGLELVDRLDGLAPSERTAREAVELLRGWDGRLTADSVGGALYEVLRYTLLRNLLEPALGEELRNQFMGEGFHPLLMASSEFYGHDTVVLLRLLDDPASWWLDRAGGREAVLERSLGQAVEWLRGKLGADPASWEWGRIHRVAFHHALGLQKPLDRVFDRGPFAIGGDTDTLCQTAIHANAPYDNTSWSPSFRQIVDLGDLSRSLVIHPPGQSGQLGSPHYDDLAPLWLNGEYHPMLWERQQVELAAEGRLLLQST